MLHIHFGAGRLGLGLVVPFFQTGPSESFILNRTLSTTRPTGSTALTPRRRNDLLRDGSRRAYLLRQTGQGARRQRVGYHGFFEYGEDDVEDVVRAILDRSERCRNGVVVTASLLSAANYRPVLQALNLLAQMRARGSVGPVCLVACENTLNAHEVFADPGLRDWIPEETRRHVLPVHALVDRVCMELEEGRDEARPAVVVRTERYGSLKLALTPETEVFARMLAGSRVEFTRHVAVEKQIKNWLLNGSHWLLALAAFQDSRGDAQLTLNEFLKSSAASRQFACEVMAEMREGIAAILRRDPAYADFVRDIDPDAYLAGASDAILKRFLSNDDPMSRILARFQAPTPEAPTTVEAFTERFAGRVGQPIIAYAEKMGVAPPAAMHSVESLASLIVSGTYINGA
jgi:hypothetical protein